MRRVARCRHARHWSCLLVLLVVAVFAPMAWGGGFELPVHGLVVDVKPLALTRADPERELDPLEMLRSDEGFVPFDPALDKSAPVTWLKLELSASPDSSGQYVLRVARRFFKHFELHVAGPEGRVSHYRLSADQASDAHTVGRQYVIHFTVPREGSTTLLIGVETFQASLRPVELWIQDESGFAHSQAETYLLFGLVFGVLIALIFHNLVLYLSLRQRGHLYYVMAMASLLLMLGVDSGMLQNYVLPAALQPHVGRIQVLSVAAMLATASLFFQVFVDSARHTPRLTSVIRIVTVLVGVLALAQLAVPMAAFPSVVMLIQLLVGVILLMLLLGAFLAGRKGVVEGWFFLAAWSLLIASNLARTVLSFDLAERSVVLEYLLYIGAVMEASILALGLAYRVRELKSRHTKALREQHEAARLANLDALTNVYNRRFLQNYLTNMLSARSGSLASRAVLILDLDRFKETNDTFGHAAGDSVLRGLVERCQRVLREGDVLCRLGGDEFVIVLAGQRDSSGLEVAGRIIEEVAGGPFVFEGMPMPVTTSIGVVSGIPAGASVSGVLRMADQALYQAKQAGRNRAVVFDPDKATPFGHGPSLAVSPDREEA